MSSSALSGFAAIAKAKQAEIVTEGHMLPFSSRMQDTVIKLITVNPAMRAIEEYDWMPRFMQPRFVLVVYPDSLRVVTYGFVAQDFKDVRGKTPTTQHTKCVVRLMSNNLFHRTDEDTDSVATIHCQPFSTNCKVIDEIIRYDIDNVVAPRDTTIRKNSFRQKIRPHSKLAKKTIELVDNDFNSDAKVKSLPPSIFRQTVVPIKVLAHISGISIIVSRHFWHSLFCLRELALIIFYYYDYYYYYLSLRCARLRK